MRVCINCKREKNLQEHHIVPLSNGGNDIDSNVVKLCGECHNKINGVDRKDNISELTKKGMKDAKDNGKKLGRPKEIKDKTKNKVKTLREDGYSYRDIEDQVGISKTSVGRILSSA